MNIDKDRVDMMPYELGNYADVLGIRKDTLPDGRVLIIHILKDGMGKIVTFYPDGEIQADIPYDLLDDIAYRHHSHGASVEYRLLTPEYKEKILKLLKDI